MLKGERRGRVQWKTKNIEIFKGVELEDLRTWDDFYGEDRFAAPPVQELDRAYNRIISNLLYYQSNYFLLAIPFLAAAAYASPLAICMILAFGLYRVALKALKYEQDLVEVSST